MNEKIINKRWGYTRKELKQFRKDYDKLNKETQDKLQEIFTSYNITYDKLYKTISYLILFMYIKKVSISKLAMFYWKVLLLLYI